MPTVPQGRWRDRHIRAAYDDPAALDELAARCAAVTVEFENVPAGALQRLARRVPVRPSGQAVLVAQDRIREKTFLRDHGFATAPFAAVTRPMSWSRRSTRLALRRFSRPAAWDTTGRARRRWARRRICEPRSRASAACRACWSSGSSWKESCRWCWCAEWTAPSSPFPSVRTSTGGGILDTTVVPARIAPALAAQADGSPATWRRNSAT